VLFYVKHLLDFRILLTGFSKELFLLSLFQLFVCLLLFCVDVAPSLIEALDERADLSSFTAATRDVLSVVDRDESDPEIARSDLHSVAMRVVKSVIRAARDDMRSTSN
jgi:hypothetical protein